MWPCASWAYLDNDDDNDGCSMCSIFVWANLFIEDVWSKDQTIELDFFSVIGDSPAGFNHILLLKGGPPDVVWGVVVPVIDLVELVADLIGEVVAGLAVAFELSLNLAEEFKLGKITRDNDCVGLRGSSLFEAKAATNSDTFARRRVENGHLLRR